MREVRKEKRGYDRKKDTYKTSIIVRKNISKNKFPIGTFVSLWKDCLNKKRAKNKTKNKSVTCKIEMRKDKRKTKRKKKS